MVGVDEDVKCLAYIILIEKHEGKDLGLDRSII
jgi:hypothetical protein